MKAFLDTSVLVATFYGKHEHHDASLALLVRLTKKTGCTAAHCMAEVYSVLGGMPGKDRVTPDEALLFLADVRERLAIITLSEADYVHVLAKAGASGLVGGGICDGLLSRCALKANADVLYTWNVKHFTRLGPDVAAIVRRPYARHAARIATRSGRRRARRLVVPGAAPNPVSESRQDSCSHGFNR